MANTMTAAVFEGPGQPAIRQRPRPQAPRPGDLLLRVEAAGICGTDVQILRDPPGHPAKRGIVLGHEFCGTIEACGPGVDHLAPGDRVVVDPNLYCGACSACQEGRKNHCSRMSTLGIFEDGGFAAWCRVPASNAYRADPALPPEILVFCEPLSCVVNALDKLRIAPGDRALVFGAGPMGQLFILALRAAGVSRVAVVEPSAVRRALASRSGATELFEAAPAGAAWELVVDAVGRCLPQCVRATRTGGQVLLLGMIENLDISLPQYEITRRELRIVGSFIAGNAFPRTVRLLEQGSLDPTHLITHRISVAELPMGIDRMRGGDAIKVLVTP